ncbi:MAG: DUF2244 domain-containing protein [Gammaproteobacteria bacterium]|nr:DUF2244 domain-containing protein [Gammaproteobacteria bacterium]
MGSFGVLAAVSLTVAAGMASVGAWPVLPFAGLELAALWAGLYAAHRQAERREVVWVDEDLVAVEKGRRAPEQHCEFPRGWAQVILEPPASPCRSSRLFVRSHGREVEIGAWLNEEERAGLAHDLAQALGVDGRPHAADPAIVSPARPAPNSKP